MPNVETIKYGAVTPEEHLQTLRLQGFVFAFDAFDKATDEAVIREKIARGELDNGVTYAAVDQKTGRVLSGMDVIPYTMWFDGQKAAMHGIGGVASTPETRRQGNIRKLFEKVLADIDGQGAVFSHLYPFSYDYYRKFGYEHCGSAAKYTLPLASARKLKTGGTAHEFAAGDSAREDLIAVYESYASRHNAMVSRGERQWKKVFDLSFTGADRLYYWRDENGAVRSWAKFKRNGDIMEISDIAWANHDGMLGILQFMGMFDGAAKKMSLVAGAEFIPELYWESPYDIEVTRQWLGMSRAVNAKRALELIRKPDSAGCFTIKLTDDFAAWNSRAYLVEYGGGACEVLETARFADIEAGAGAFAQLLLGTYGLPQLARRADIRVNGDARELAKVFCKKPVLIADYF